MEHCVWTVDYKIYYLKTEKPSGYIEFCPIKMEDGIKRKWCEPCKIEVTKYREEYSRIRRIQEAHSKMNHGHCYECANCQPYSNEIADDAPFCRPERCVICFMVPPICIEKDACPKSDIIKVMEISCDEEIDMT